MSRRMRDPLRPWTTMDVDDARDELRRAEGLAATMRGCARSDPDRRAVYLASAERADERAAAYRAGLT